MASVTFKSVSKVFPGPVHAVREFTLDVRDGEFVVLVGPSGCGKSTLLRMVAGLERLTSGSISIGDRIVDDVAPRNRDIAMVFQNYALYPHMNVYRNMAFALRMRKVARDRIDTRVREVAELLGITDLLERRPRDLSGGQQQRVALGRAIVREPKCYLFDEPLSNLDAKLRVQMRGELKALHLRLGTTTLYVTHDQEEAMTLGDRVVVLGEGRTQQVGRPLEVYRRPANSFVAGFVGSPPMNLITGRLGRQEQAVWFDDGAGVRLAVTSDDAASGNGEVVLGIRPEALRVATDAGPATPLEVTVEVCEPVGDRTDVHVRSDGGTRLIARIPATDDLNPGQRVRIGVDDGDVHLFAAGPYGQRL